MISITQYIIAFILLFTGKPEFGDRLDLGLINNDSLNEVSGLAASRKNSNVLWTHNDSGDENRVFAIDANGPGMVAAAGRLAQMPPASAGLRSGEAKGYEDGIQGLFGKVVPVIQAGCLFAQEKLGPMDLAATAIGLFYRSIPDTHTGCSDIRADAVTLDVTQYRVVRDHQLIINGANFIAILRV